MANNIEKINIKKTNTDYYFRDSTAIAGINSTFNTLDDVSDDLDLAYLGLYEEDYNGDIEDIINRLDVFDTGITDLEEEITYRQKPYNQQYFTIERTSTEKVKIKWPHQTSTYNLKTLYYSFDRKNWTTIKSNAYNYITLDNSHNKVYLKGNNYRYWGNSSGDAYMDIDDVIADGETVKGKFKAYGSIGSLFRGDNFVGYSTYGSGDYVFAHFFESTNIVDASNLILPATSIGRCYYYHLFYGCTLLTKGPTTINATSLGIDCCNGMFSGCSALTTAPALPATTLAGAGGCYQEMFMNCTSLTSTPALPATTLEINCYRSMFEGCTHLTTAVQNLNGSFQDFCYHSMFKGCTSLTTAPAINGGIYLPNGCCAYMFYGCYNLNYMAYTSNWASGVNPYDLMQYNVVGNLPFREWVNYVFSSGRFDNYHGVGFRRLNDSGYAYDGIPVSFTEYDGGGNIRWPSY